MGHVSEVRSIESASLLRRNFRNWGSVALFLRRSKGLSANITVKFRDAQSSDETILRSELKELIQYCRFAESIGVAPAPDLHVLVTMKRDIEAKLQRQFTKEEIERWSTGARFDINAMSLLALVRRHKPKTAVETGVGQGITTYTMLNAMQLNGGGTLISVDIPNRNPEGYINKDGQHDFVYTPEGKDPGWLIPDRLRSNWDFRLGTSAMILPTIHSRIDLFFHDSEESYSNMTFEYGWALEHLREGGILASLNIGWNSAFKDFRRANPGCELLYEGNDFGVFRTSSS